MWHPGVFVSSFPGQRVSTMDRSNGNARLAPHRSGKFWLVILVILVAMGGTLAYLWSRNDSPSSTVRAQVDSAPAPGPGSAESPSTPPATKTTATPQPFVHDWLRGRCGLGRGRRGRGGGLSCALARRWGRVDLCAHRGGWRGVAAPQIGQRPTHRDQYHEDHQPGFAGPVGGQSRIPIRSIHR